MGHALRMIQPSLEGFESTVDAIEQCAGCGDVEERGAIYTRPEIAEFLLDLAGYLPERPLYRRRLLEPSFGGGDVLLAAVRRLLAVVQSDRYTGDLAHCIRAVELHRSTFDATALRLQSLLHEFGFTPAECTRLTQAWLVCADFLLVPLSAEFDVVVGNPPYVRQERIPPALLAQYRQRYATLYDRADLYVPFMERSLDLLVPGGQVAFICANRWTKNQYGGPLRAKVANGFHLRAYVDMVGTAAFDSDVMAYPAITLIEKAPPGPTWMATQPSIDSATLTLLAHALREGLLRPELGVSRVDKVGGGGAPWVLGPADQRALLRRLEERFPTLEETGCKVGIGVATGADKVFIGAMEDLDVESSRKLPLVTTKDIASGVVRWRGLGVINPFENNGQLVDLDQYPKLRTHLDRHRETVAKRHVAQKSPAHWYRTIDRITPSLAMRPKLLIPDIKGSAHVVFEEGWLYPHHNLYFVVSEEWELRALQAVLLSCVTRQFISAYSTVMHGGFLRYQAQYLRRIRLPRWSAVPESLRMQLAHAAMALDLPACDQAACELYGLTPEEFQLLARQQWH
jgi:hypothetical protein